MGTPNDVGGGVVVRVRCAGGGITVNSKRMGQAAADTLAARFETALSRAEGGEFVVFESVQGDVKIRADKVTTIEVCRVAPSLHNGYERAVPTGAGVETR